MSLSLHGSELTNVFRLNGIDENSASFALGWALDRCSTFREQTIHELFGADLPTGDAVIRLQAHGKDKGYTDVEIQAGLSFHVIIEAKRAWDLPSIQQLSRYTSRLLANRANHQLLVTISAATRDFARRRLPEKIDGVTLAHLSWTDIHRLASSSGTSSRGFEQKLWLRQLNDHLKDFTTMERSNDNSVFVVVLGSAAMVAGQQHTWIDVVEKDRSYFHPVGNHWPVQPVNYIGFRYNGRLQSVHHVDSFDVVEDVSACNPAWIPTSTDHFVYRLGPPMRPSQEMKTGNLFKNQRVRCAVDTLLSGACRTIEEARNETMRRTEKLF